MIAVLAGMLATAASAQDSTRTPLAPAALAPAALAGVVNDSSGAPLAGVEVVLTGTQRGTRSDDAGRFSIVGVAPGAYRVWFRRLGYASTQFDWVARAGVRTEVVVAMTPIARTLDPVVVRAQEDRDMASRASILGLVIDSSGAPIDEAEIQLVGANRYGTTRANGGFLFSPLAVGAYLVRVRKLGFEPSTVKLTLVAGDDREVIVRMRRLPPTLDPVVVTARSGYDTRDQLVFDDLEKRMRWKSFRTPILGPEDLRRFYGSGLDEAVKVLIGPRRSGHGYGPTSIMGGPGRQRMSRLDAYDASGCILLNGKTPLYQPLHTFTTDDVDLLEVYPSGTELTGTVAWRMTRPECKAASLMDHPTYYVLWLKGAR